MLANASASRREAGRSPTKKYLCKKSIENFFAKLKQYHAATRYHKLKVNFLAIYLAATVICSPNDTPLAQI
ncbi:hypothetical protein FACHB389_31345 [Nostoc calcicola FACHB-389]|nr:hypothetical protein [Nostoc calcicola FACHB-3891]OKH21916.1 hypothetical protein FACHB389_31345 [Nostoc calcicola FACHB-389]